MWHPAFRSSGQEFKFPALSHKTRQGRGNRGLEIIQKGWASPNEIRSLLHVSPLLAKEARSGHLAGDSNSSGAGPAVERC